jgi:DNA-binding NarL/FixJ family response regulator
MIKVAIVDDHRMFRKSLSLLINSFSDADVLFEASNGTECIARMRDQVPDVVLLDIQMPEMNGFDTCKSLHENHPDVKVLILSELNDRETIRKIIDCGAHGYFTKNSDPLELELALRKIHNNGFYFADDLASVLRDTILHTKTPLIAANSSVTFTAREIEIIKLAAQEHSSSEIAEKIFINVRTVETHRKRIMEKTSSKNFLGVVLFALRTKLFELDEV